MSLNRIIAQNFTSSLSVSTMVRLNDVDVGHIGLGLMGERVRLNLSLRNGLNVDYTRFYLAS